MILNSLFTTLIEIPSWGNITLIETIWVLSGVITVAFCGSHLRPLWHDYQLAKEIPDRPILRIVTWSYVRREIIRLLQGLAIIGLGIYTFTEGPVVPGPAVVTYVGLVLTAVLVMLNLTTSLQSWWDFHTRAQAKRYLLGEESFEEIPPEEDDGT